MKFYATASGCIGCLENDDLENNDLENDDRDGVARRIKGLEGYRRREIRGRWEGIMKG